MRQTSHVGGEAGKQVSDRSHQQREAFLLVQHLFCHGDDLSSVCLMSNSLFRALGIRCAERPKSAILGLFQGAMAGSKSIFSL
jgi:hypothetical protein